MARFLILALILLSSCNNSSNTKAGWQKVFQNDELGKTTFGDKSALIDAVRLGYPIRIGWGGSRVEHVADADFLTIFQGEEVFAQIKTIIGQAPAIEGDSLKIRFRQENHWTMIAGSNGYFSGMMTNYMQDTLVGGGADRYRPFAWYVNFPRFKNNIEARPLWSESSPNWEKWNQEN